MTTSTNSDEIQSAAGLGGALADCFTLLRILLMPAVAFLIWKGWQPVSEGGIDLALTLLASFLFVVAALSDMVDDYLGGSQRSAHRRFGYLDDIADSILVIGTLLALLYVTRRAGLSSWVFTVPAAILILREIVIGLFKGFELSRYGWPDTKLSAMKAAFSMLAVCLLLASPWLQVWIDKLTAGDDVAGAFATNSPWVWAMGQAVLWIAAVLSLITAKQIFQTDFKAAATTESANDE